MAWKNPATGQYTVWSIDSNGNYRLEHIGRVRGSSTALQSIESHFHQDLNGDGTIGASATRFPTVDKKNQRNDQPGRDRQ